MAQSFQIGDKVRLSEDGKKFKRTFGCLWPIYEFDWGWVWTYSKSGPRIKWRGMQSQDFKAVWDVNLLEHFEEPIDYQI